MILSDSQKPIHGTSVSMDGAMRQKGATPNPMLVVVVGVWA